MDAVDVFKVLLRRWYVFLPMVLGAAGLSVAAGDRIQPEYHASASMILLGPAQADNAEGGLVNPYRAAGTATTSEALVLVVTSPASRAAVAGQGLEASYELEAGSRTPIIEIRASSGDRGTAVETVRVVQQLVVNELQRRQDAVMAGPGQRLALDNLAPADISFSVVEGLNRLRAVIVGGGLITAAVAALVVDSLAVRLRRRRRGRGTVEAPDVPPTSRRGTAEHKHNVAWSAAGEGSQVSPREKRLARSS